MPTRMLLDSPVTPWLPISILKLPVVRLDPAKEPNAVLLLPVLLESAPEPVAVLKLPVSLLASAERPVAVLFVPPVLLPRGGDTGSCVEVSGNVPPERI